MHSFPGSRSTGDPGHAIGWVHLIRGYHALPDLKRPSGVRLGGNRPMLVDLEPGGPTRECPPRPPPTAAVLGTPLIFWTSNAVCPDFSALIGSMIFGGPLGFI